MDKGKIIKDAKRIAQSAFVWVNSHRAITAIGVIAFIPVVLILRGCYIVNSINEQHIRAMEERASEAKISAEKSELFRLVSARYIDEDSLENRKALKRIRELAMSYGVDVTNEKSESLLYCAYKNDLPEKFIFELKSLGAQLSDDEAFEVRRVATETLKKNLHNLEIVKKCFSRALVISELDDDPKESLLLKSLRDLRTKEISLSDSSIFLSEQGFSLRQEEKCLLEQQQKEVFWQEINNVISNDYRANEIISSCKERIAKIKEFGKIGLDVYSILTSFNKSPIYIGGGPDTYISRQEYEGMGALFLLRLKQLAESTKDHPRAQGTAERIGEICILLEKYGLALSESEKALFQDRKQELLARVGKVLLEDVVSKKNVGLSSFEKLLSCGVDKGLCDRAGNSLLYLASLWDFPFPENSKSNEIRTPLEKEKIDLLKKYGFVMKEAEERELKRKSQKWIVDYFSHDSFFETFVCDGPMIPGSASKENWTNSRGIRLILGMNIVEASEIDALQSFLQLLPDPDTANSIANHVKNMCRNEMFGGSDSEKLLSVAFSSGCMLPREIPYKNSMYGRFRFAKEAFGGIFSEASIEQAFFENANRQAHSLLYVAWDKGYSKEILGFLISRGLRYINEEESVINAVEKNKSTFILCLLISNTKNLTLETLRECLVTMKPDVNAKFCGKSILWWAKKNGLNADLIKLLEESGAKLAPGE